MQKSNGNSVILQNIVKRVFQVFSSMLENRRVAEWLAFQASDHGVMGSSPTGGVILTMKCVSD